MSTSDGELLDVNETNEGDSDITKSAGDKRKTSSADADGSASVPLKLVRGENGDKIRNDGDDSTECSRKYSI